MRHLKTKQGIKNMSYLMMEIKGWDRGAICKEPTVSDVNKQFNLAAGDIDENFGVIRLDADNYVVMASVEAAKKMLAQHVDNTVAGKGPFVDGPFSNSQLQPYNGSGFDPYM